jgi:WD40 repeat protein
MSSPSVFLSYARADDEPFVRRLHDDLVHAGVEVWWDRQAMQSRGRTFLQELRDAIQGVDRLLAIIGPNALESDYVRVEWDHARLFARGIVPVLRKGDFESAPRELSVLDGVDMVDDGHYDERLAELVRLIAEPVIPLCPFLSEVPALPPRFQSLPADYRRLWETVLPDLDRPVTVAADELTTLLHGMGGLGKSVLASAFCRSVDTRRSFETGILWLSVGRERDLLSLVREAGVALGDEPLAYTDDTTARNRLTRALSGKSCLIVLDDAWDLRYVTPFLNAVSPPSRLLVTSRIEGLVPGARSVSIDSLGEKAALRFLADWSGTPVDELPPEAHAVVEECGALPFALSVCGAMRLAGTDWSDLLEALRTADLAYLEHAFPNYEQYDTPLKCIQASVDLLADADHVARFRELRPLFDVERHVEEAAIVHCWAHQGLSARHGRRLLRRLKSQGLLEADASAAEPTFSMHDLVHDYLRASGPDAVAEHRMLLDRLAANGPWWQVPCGRHLLRHLAEHMQNADRARQFLDVLFDVRWLSAKLEGLGVEAILDDCGRFAGHRDVRLLLAAVRMSSGALEADPRQLVLHLLGRFEGETGERIAALRKTIALGAPGAWLRPVRSGLIPADSPLLRTFDEEMEIIVSVAVCADETLVAAVDEACTLHVWDLGTGRRVHAIEPQDDRRFSCVAALPMPNWALVGTEQGAVLHCDLETGRCEQSLRLGGAPIEGLTLNGDGTRAAAFDDQGGVFVWVVGAGDAPRALASGIDEIDAIAASADGRFIFIRGGGAIEQRTTEDGRLLRSIPAPGWGRIALSVDGQHLAIINRSERSCLIVLESGERATLEHEDETSGNEWAIRFLSDGELLSAGEDGVLRRFAVPGGAELASHIVESSPIYDIAVFASDTRIVTGVKASRLRVFDLERLGAARETERHRWAVTGIVAVPAHDLVVSGSQGGAVRGWRMSTGEPLWDPVPERSDRLHAVDVAFDAARDRIVILRHDGDLERRDPLTGALLDRVEGGWKDMPLPALALSRDGSTVVAAMDRALGTSAVWRFDDDRVEEAPLPGLESGVLAPASVSAGNRRAVWLGMGTYPTRLWDLRSGQGGEPEFLEGRRPAWVSFGPRDPLLLVLFEGGRLELFDVDAARSLWSREVDAGYDRAAMAADERAVLLWGSRRMGVYDVESDAVVASLIGDYAWTVADLVPDRDIVVAGDFRGNVHVLEFVRSGVS